MADMADKDEISGVGTDVSGIGANIYGNSADISGIRTDIADAVSDASGIEINIADVGIDTSVIGADIAYVGVDTSDIGADIDGAVTDATDIGADINDIIADTPDIGINIASISTAIAGIGTDIASISQIKELDENTKGAFVRSTFSASERQEAEAEAEKIGDPYRYYGGRFAAKEAVFKAIAPLIDKRKFDFRIIETLKREDGSPYIRANDSLKGIMERAGVSKIFISLSKEGDLALAFAVAVK